MKGHQTIPKEVPMKELKKGINEVLAQTAVEMVMNCEDCNVRK